LRRMARGHRLDETEQGATLQQKTWKFGTWIRWMLDDVR
jgi:hypothetical protein